MQTLRDILVAEDDAVTRRRLAFLLKKNGYTVDLAEDGETAWRLFQENPYPIVLTDWSMPGMDGPDLCKLIREFEHENEYTYLILITGKTEKSKVAEGLASGADDYVTKPFDSGELLARLRTGQRIISLQSSMREAHRQLQVQASRDGLTGVMNRRALEDRLREVFSYSQRRGASLSVALLDLDYFKAVNDTYGHQVGDDVLKAAASRVQSVIREYDAVGRYGGEEFLVMLPDTSVEEAKMVAERIRKAVEQAEVSSREQVSVAVTVSVGVATVSGEYREDAKSLVERADNALYQAKKEGRNRVVVSYRDGFQSIVPIAI